MFCNLISFTRGIYFMKFQHNLHLNVDGIPGRNPKGIRIIE